jgi:hypothetical protein
VPRWLLPRRAREVCIVFSCRTVLHHTHAFLLDNVLVAKITRVVTRFRSYMPKGISGCLPVVLRSSARCSHDHVDSARFDYFMQKMADLKTPEYTSIDGLLLSFEEVYNGLREPVWS